jgi:hypothetical protein
MNGVRVRIATALLTFATVLVAAAPATAQTPSERQQQRVYRDYRTDGLIDACRHDVETLRAVLDGIQTSTDVNSPDFRPQVEAAIQEQQTGSCASEQAPATAAPGGSDTNGQTDSGSTPSATGDTGTSGDTGSSSSGSTGSGSSGDTGSGSSSDSGSQPPDDTSSSDTGDLGGAVTGGGGGGGSGGADNSTPPTAAEVDPLPTETPVPAATPVPTPAEAAPPAATPAVVYRNPDDGIPPALIALAALLGLLALLAFAYAVVSQFGWAERRLARPRRAWREAAFRAGGAWGDFTDWLRLGR